MQAICIAIYVNVPICFVFLFFSGTVCIPLNHLCADNDKGHLKVPTAHWRQAKKHGIDSSVCEISSTSCSNTATMAGESIVMANTSFYDKNSSINYGKGSQRTGLRKNENSASWRQSLQNVDGDRNLHHRRSSAIDVTNPRNAAKQQIWI